MNRKNLNGYRRRRNRRYPNNENRLNGNNQMANGHNEDAEIEEIRRPAENDNYGDILSLRVIINPRISREARQLTYFERLPVFCAAERYQMGVIIDNFIQIPRNRRFDYFAIRPRQMVSPWEMRLLNNEDHRLEGLNRYRTWFLNAGNARNIGPRSQRDNEIYNLFRDYRNGVIRGELFDRRLRCIYRNHTRNLECRLEPNIIVEDEPIMNGNGNEYFECIENGNGEESNGNCIYNDNGNMDEILNIRNIHIDEAETISHNDRRNDDCNNQEDIQIDEQQETDNFPHESRDIEEVMLQFNEPHEDENFPEETRDNVPDDNNIEEEGLYFNEQHYAEERRENDNVQLQEAIRYGYDFVGGANNPRNMQLLRNIEFFNEAIQEQLLDEARAFERADISRRSRSLNRNHRFFDRMNPQ